MSQIGPEGLAQLRKVAAAYQGSGAPEEDDDIPELVENFEEASEKK